MDHEKIAEAFDALAREHRRKAAKHLREAFVAEEEARRQRAAWAKPVFVVQCPEPERRPLDVGDILRRAA